MEYLGLNFDIVYVIYRNLILLREYALHLLKHKLCAHDFQIHAPIVLQKEQTILLLQKGRYFFLVYK